MKGEGVPHMFCEIGSPVPFELTEIEEPNFDNMFHVSGSGKLYPGEADGRSRYDWNSLYPVPQWKITVKNQCRIYFKVHKTINDAKHTFHILGSEKDEKIRSEIKFKNDFTIHGRYSDEEYFFDIIDINLTFF